MKNIFAILTLICLCPGLGFAVTGVDSSGGGNGYAAEFIRTATWGLEVLSRQGSLNINGQNVDLGFMGHTLSDATVAFTKQPLTLDGKEVHAINEPAKKLITVNDDAWASLSDTTRLQLVFHELWGLSFHDHKDDAYIYSTEMVKRFRNDASFSARVISLVTTLQNGRGKTYRAMVVRQGGEDRSNLAVIFQELQEVDDQLDLITANVVYDPTELTYGTDTVVENMRLDVNIAEGTDAFSFEVDSMSAIVPRLTCSYELPEEPNFDGLSKQTLSCKPARKP